MLKMLLYGPHPHLPPFKSTQEVLLYAVNKQEQPSFLFVVLYCFVLPILRTEGLSEIIQYT